MWDADVLEVVHAAALGLAARGVGEGGREYSYRRLAEAFEFDGVGDVDRGRGAAVTEAEHDGIAFGELGEVGLREVVLGRELANLVRDRGAVTLRQNLGEPGEE